MKRSLRIRFTLIFTGLTAAILIGIWCVNNWMLESFYVQDKVQTLELAYEQMNIMVMDCLDEGKAIADEFAGSDKLDSGEQTDAVRLLKTLNDKYSIMTVIVDGINDKVIVSSARDAGFMIDKAKKYIIGNDDRRAQIIKQDNNFTIQKTFEPHSRSFYLECWGYYSDNNTIFIMTTPLASIRESVELSNRFLAYVGIAALILGSVIIYFVSKTVTSPILKLSEIAKRMSKLDFEANIAETKRVADVAKALDIPCEAELGKVGGKEDDLEAEADTNTDPQEAKEFVERTGVTSLAVAIGTAHGFYVGTPVLDKERLSEIREVVDIPLVLHGASGLSDEDVMDCVKRGICKVNFATELRAAYSKAVKELLAEKPDTIDPKAYGKTAIAAVKELVMARMKVCGCDGKAE